MEIIEVPGARIMHTPEIPYLRVDLHDLIGLAAYQEALESADLWRVISEQKVKAACVNHCPLEMFSTDYFFYLRDKFLPKAASAGLAKISAVVQEEIWQFMANLSEPLTVAGGELRFFPQSQFYNTAESIAWF